MGIFKMCSKSECTYNLIRNDDFEFRRAVWRYSDVSRENFPENFLRARQYSPKENARSIINILFLNEFQRFYRCISSVQVLY